jgi:hypothetical protein
MNLLMLGYLAALVPSLVALAWLAGGFPPLNRAHADALLRRVRVGNRRFILASQHVARGRTLKRAASVFEAAATKCSTKKSRLLKSAFITDFNCDAFGLKASRTTCLIIRHAFTSK